jgi:type IV pilus assembly protein PilB
MITITGPTGSGKTTTLYGAVQTLSSSEVKIVTVEDPVEYALDGVTQVEVNDSIGRTFASALRAFLRHDPDVILVGEMRDPETAQVAVRAALTGHLVLTTLHTNDCPSTIARLVDLGVPGFLVSAALRVVVAQRLVRKLCRACKEPYEVDEETLVPYGYNPAAFGRKILYRRKGCKQCRFTGMMGRLGLYQVMPFTDELRDISLAKPARGDIDKIARAQGMRTLRETGLEKVIEGVTTLEEVLRVTVE